MEVFLLQRAEADSQQIYNYLEDFFEGRGEVFLKAVDAGFAHLVSFP